MADLPGVEAGTKNLDEKEEKSGKTPDFPKQENKSADTPPPSGPRVFAPDGAVIPPEETLAAVSIPSERKTVKKAPARTRHVPSRKKEAEAAPDSSAAAVKAPTKPARAKAKARARAKEPAAAPAAQKAPAAALPKIQIAATYPQFVQQLWLMNPLHKVVPLDWQELTESYLTVVGRASTETERTTEKLTALNRRLWRDSIDAWVSWSANLMGKPAAGIPDTDALDREDDPRFNKPEWTQIPMFRVIAKSYKAYADYLVSEAEREDLEPDERRRLSFNIRQLLDATSPALSYFTNPVAMKRAFETGGASLAEGWRNFLADLKLGTLSMTDVTAFKPGVNIACTPGKVVYRNRLIELIQYKPTTEKVHETPLLMMGPWINKFYVLDLQEKNSIVRYLLSQGITVFIISWRNPDEKMESMTFEDYMVEGPVAASDVIREITGAKKMNVAGYCIGGVLLTTVLAALGHKKDDRFNSATYMVSMQDFTEPGDTKVFVNKATIKNLDQTMTDLGYLDARWMSNMFSLLRANDLIWSTVVNNYLLGNKPAAFDLLYWNSDSTRMARAAHSYYLRHTYVDNDLIKPGKLTLMGSPIDLKNITLDVYSAAAEKDHIVPWISSWRITQLTGGKVRFVLSASGHVAGMINPPTKSKSGYWVSDTPQPTYAEWQAKADYHKGSWWPDWAAWLVERSGGMVEPPPMGSKKHAPICDAPGIYVHERS